MKETSTIEVEMTPQELRGYFELLGYRVIDEKRDHDAHPTVEAVIHLKGPDGKEVHVPHVGNGPVNALDLALRKGLAGFYPDILEPVSLCRYKVTAVPNGHHRGTASHVEVALISTDGERYWKTRGRGQDVIEASWQALAQSYAYHIHRNRAA